MFLKPKKNIEVSVKIDTSWMIVGVFLSIAMAMTTTALLGKNVTTSFGNFKMEINSTRTCRMMPAIPEKREVLMAEDIEDKGGKSE
jgi:hypothetical protein